MTDLAILVPSRGRPASVARLVDACEKTCRTNVVLHFGFDLDDETRPRAITASIPVAITEADRMGLVAWTNHLASRYANRPPPYLASLGDDMVPLTDGWDEQLITVIEHKFSGTGYVYPDDRRRSDIPEAVIMSSRIVAALGWMALPSLEHWFCDCVWRDLGMGAGCIAYVPDVVVEHRHPNVTGEQSDATYSEAARSFHADLGAYQKWRLHRMNADIATVRTCLNHQ